MKECKKSTICNICGQRYEAHIVIGTDTVSVHDLLIFNKGMALRHNKNSAMFFRVGCFRTIEWKPIDGLYENFRMAMFSTGYRRKNMLEKIINVINVIKIKLRMCIAVLKLT